MQTGVRKLEFSELTPRESHSKTLPLVRELEFSKSTSNKSHSKMQTEVSKLEFLIKSKFLGVSKFLLLLNLIPYTKFIIFSHINSEKSNL